MSEKSSFQNRVHNNHSIPLLNIMPADQQEHDIGTVGKHLCVADCDADDEADDQPGRNDDARRDIAGPQQGPVIPPERLLAEVGIKKLIGMREVGWLRT